MRHNSLTFLVSPLFETPISGGDSSMPGIQAESFPLGVYTAAMYPPRVSDHDIKLLIRELTMGDQLPSGASLRAALQDRFGSRGGVSRIYRLLSAARAVPSKATGTPANSFEVGKLQHEIRSLEEALKLADYREETHQSRWALEVDRLRQQVAALEPLALRAKSALDTADLLRHQLHAAHVRISVLEQQVLEVTGTGEKGGR